MRARSHEKKAKAAAGRRNQRRLQQMDKISGMLAGMAFVLIILILISQFALQFELVRVWVTGVDRLEGRPLP